jgi:TM2 domain-containing membrane protein YozV
VTALTTEELMLIEQRVTNAKKSTGAAYLLWFFLWFLSGHRFYLGRTGTAFLQIASYFVLVGFIWIVVDAFLIPGMICESNDRERDRLIAAMRSHKSVE